MSSSPDSSAEAAIGARQTAYDYFRAFDNLREAPDVEPYELSNRIHGYESSRGLRVLDYGCGNGYVLSHYARGGATTFGVDLTRAALERARSRFQMLGLAANLLQGDGETIPLASEALDVVCSMGVIHHVQNPRPVIGELHRVLRPGGRLILMVYNKNSFRYRVTFWWRTWFGGPQFRGKSIEQISNMNDGPECPVALAYSKDDMTRLLERFTDIQFTVAKLGTSELALFSPTLTSLLNRLLPGRLLSALARRIGWNLYIQAIKPKV